ncbi:carboxylesterase/lipase family protein [Flagellimonas lutimaris]|uniref:carboxylesterase/lipase family protein n=1 Tax=Flagellimonas lutimaris TaxID=475082 RepID=UPI003F5CD36F
MKKSIMGLLLLFSVVMGAQQKGQDTDLVTTESGILKGVQVNDVVSFKGIPYAAPPVGEFRWRPPQPVSAWTGVREASTYGPDCAQSGWGGAPGSIVEGSSEDCLYLNIWKPADATAKDKLPVMVWIHGGGFTGGSGSGAGIAGDAFAEQGVVLITFNYRLGRLGHFAFPALSDEHPGEAKGSYAYMDQIAALQWLQRNIGAFGGDPENVTIFGFSAGGVSVHSLMTIPDALGLFDKAISHSGGARDGVLTGRPIREENADIFYKESAETIGINFAKKHGVEGTDADALAKLRALPVEEIVDGGQETDGQGGPRIYSGPILDGTLVVETAESAYIANRQAKVPLMIGSCSAEVGGSFVNNSSTKEELFALFGDLGGEAKSVYDPKGDKEFAEVIAKFNTDWVWAEPARFTANTFVAAGEPVYFYHFDFVSDPMKERMPYGAGHGTDISYVFNTLDARWGNPEKTAEDEKLAETMNTYWANFAKTGNPNGEGLPQWPGYTPESNMILDIQSNGVPVGKIDPRKARLDLIEKAVKIREKLQSRGI